MAAEIAQWDANYGADGIDLDIKGSAGSAITGNNLVIFAKLESKRIKSKYDYNSTCLWLIATNCSRKYYG